MTGAGRGIGRAIALGFAGEGATVIAVARTKERLEQVAVEARAQGAVVVPISCDVSAEHEVRALADEVDRGHGRLDVLVNAAALRMHQLGPDAALRKSVLDLTVEEWDRVIATDLRGPFLCCRFLGSSLRSAGQSSVINISAGAAISPDAGRAPYAASKAGLDALTRTLALEWHAYGIRVNSLDPGARVLTEEHKLGTRIREPRVRYLVPEALVPAALYLATSEITGERLSAFEWNEANGHGGWERWEAR